MISAALDGLKGGSDIVINWGGTSKQLTLEAPREDGAIGLLRSGDARGRAHLHTERRGVLSQG